MTRFDLPHRDPRPHIVKSNPVDDPDVVAAFARRHWFCQLCGLAGDLTQHHIIGGRGGRSDEDCNLFSCCWVPCHSQYADHSRNLGVILLAKFRADELTQDDYDRLTVLNGKPLPDFAPIPDEVLERFERTRPEVMLQPVAKFAHAWCRIWTPNLKLILPT